MAENVDPAAEAARAQAEARRQRILAKADKRLGLVSGEQLVDVSEVQSSNAARMRARRKGRFGKKSSKKADENETETESTPSTTATTESAAATTTTTTEPVETDAVVVEETEQEQNVATAAENVQSTTTEEMKQGATDMSKEDDDGDVDDEESRNVNNKSKDETRTDDNINSKAAVEDTTNKKKYIGVAKRRRQMILKKRSEETATSFSESDVASATTASTSTTFVAPPPGIRLSRIPIYMHMFIVVLLFVAGFDVGLQQLQDDDVQVHPQNALDQYGVPFVHRQLWSSSSEKQKGSGVVKDLGDLMQQQDDWMDNDDETTTTTAGSTIDPLFQVDLDDLTKGPGLLNQLARGAVAIHRFFLKIFYFFPLSLVQSVVSAPQALLQTPPALCVLALVIRQFFGKILVNADLSLFSVDKNKKNSGIDLFNMAKQWITNMLSSAFPTLVGMYDALSHLREDMYVVLCGVFVGLLWTHYQIGEQLQDVFANALGSKDEL